MSKIELKNLDYCNKALELKKNIEGSFLVLGEYLYNIKERLLYEPQWSSWTEFIFEMKMSENMAKKLIQIYSTFVLNYGFTAEQITTAGGWSVLQDILPLINNKKEALKWLATASQLTRIDLRRTIIEQKRGIPMSNCKHKNSYTINVCRDCGDRWS